MSVPTDTMLWSQYPKEVTVCIGIPADVRGKQVIFKLVNQKLRFGYKTGDGKEVIIVDGTMYGRVDVEEAIWDIDEDAKEGNKVVRMTVPKMNQAEDAWPFLTKEMVVEADYTITDKVFMDFKFENGDVERVTYGLYGKICPRTSENFRTLCTGERGAPLHYKNTRIFKAIPDFMICGGDVIHNDGTGGASIYGPSFTDENFIVKHDKPGILGMTNPVQNKNNNSSQFYVTVDAKDHMDYRKVAFGIVLDGLDTIKKIQDCGDPKGRDMIEEVVVADCGEVKE
eukprot:TRINITY_DN12236_c0_g1_i1.p1 TRINITY_DN12236_c0_g1~~TRINITY_DN12236_c0_g1_i1.p1  ORF type:complete len:295 (+),score=61.37 TRINITY_DN12236_c0_g1_i1:39-887(+)